MISAPKRPCTRPGCGELQPCSKHSTPKQSYDRQRGSAAQRGYGYAWQKYRAWFVVQVDCSVCGRNHAICEGKCREQGIVSVTFAVDHKTPHRGDRQLFWDHHNHQGLCEQEHNAKAAEERLTR